MAAFDFLFPDDYMGEWFIEINWMSVYKLVIQITQVEYIDDVDPILSNEITADPPNLAQYLHR